MRRIQLMVFFSMAVLTACGGQSQSNAPVVQRMSEEDVPDYHLLVDDIPARQHAAERCNALTKDPMHPSQWCRVRHMAETCAVHRSSSPSDKEPNSGCPEWVK